MSQYRIRVTSHPTLHVPAVLPGGGGIVIDPTRDYDSTVSAPLAAPPGVAGPPVDPGPIAYLEVWRAMVAGLAAAGFTATLEQIDTFVTDLSPSASPEDS